VVVLGKIGVAKTHRRDRATMREKSGGVRQRSRSAAALVCSCAEGRRRRGERPLESKKGGV
jgi:hypothetical protein